MTKNHLKTLAAPKNWRLLRKSQVYVTRPKPSRAFKLAMSLNTAFKSIIGKTQTTKETKHILNNTEVLVNGSREFDYRRAVGFMDIITFVETKESFRISLTSKGVLNAVQVNDGDQRLVKVSGKTRHQGKFQINCNDGTNLLVDKNNYKTGDTLVLKGKKVAKHLPLTQGATILLTGGSHLGKVGTVVEIADALRLETDGNQVTTAPRHAFVIGADKPEVTVQ